MKIIREGHPGTGMFPDTRMTDQELADTLAYLAQLRHKAHLRPGEARVLHTKEKQP
jgi:hypothetical protein